MIPLRQPTDYSCGQTCVAMLAEVSPWLVGRIVGHMNATNEKERERGFRFFGYEVGETRLACELFVEGSDIITEWPFPSAVAAVRVARLAYPWLSRGNIWANVGDYTDYCGHQLLFYGGQLWDPATGGVWDHDSHFKSNWVFTHWNQIWR